MDNEEIERRILDGIREVNTKLNESLTDCAVQREQMRHIEDRLSNHDQRLAKLSEQVIQNNTEMQPFKKLSGWVMAIVSSVITGVAVWFATKK